MKSQSVSIVQCLPWAVAGAHGGGYCAVGCGFKFDVYETSFPPPPPSETPPPLSLPGISSPAPKAGGG